MKQDILIRKFAPYDLDAALDIAVAAWAPIYEGYREQLGSEMFEAFYPDWEERKRRNIRASCMGTNGDAGCVAESGDVVVGFVSYRIDARSKCGTIGNNAVRPSHHGQGIGQSMYLHVVKLMREGGVEYVKVETGGDPAHLPARKAYEKVGFATALPSVTYFMKL
ncbi:MAG: family acetyltransferase [Paenibacillaceae bacterium]|nr:family acetyltransferase [Paenibacillaceae bacterium]